MLYALSSCIAFIGGNLLGYRRKVVRKNLRESFPDLSDKELRKIEHRFYRWLTDYFVETVKLSTMSEDEIRRRMHFENINLLTDALSDGRNVTIYLGHYCNWEWVSSLPIYFPEGAKGVQIYHPLENAASDAAFLELRGHFGAVSVPMKSTLRVLAGYKKQGVPTATGYIADQVPNYESIHYWTRFLNHDTPTFSGAEKISRMLKAKAVYLDMRCDKRGYYTGTFKEICPDASELKEFELTERYFRMLEVTIRRAPQYWLWSHRRWKRTREEYLRIYPDRKILDSRALVYKDPASGNN